MANVQSTYKKHVEERRAYGFVPLPYDVWLSWRVNKPLGELTDTDRQNHPKESI